MLPSNTNTVTKGKRPTLSTLFEPGYYLIQREIMMCLDQFSLRSLKAAAKGVNEDFHHNLQHYATKPQWYCQDGMFPSPCVGPPVKACEGAKLGLCSAPAYLHGPNYGVCEQCNERWQSECHLLENDNETTSVRTSVLYAPYRRLDKDAPPLTDPCNCASTTAKLHLCWNCRREIKKRYRRTAEHIPGEDPSTREYIIPFEPEPSKTHVLSPSSICCGNCEEAYEDWEPHRWERSPPYHVFEAIHTTGEPLQTLQCLSCKGSVRGVIVVGEDGRGGHAHFGAGQRIYINLPWAPNRCDSM